MAADRSIQSVLFVCTYNAVRSPMAEALLKKNCSRSLYIQSCGIEPGAASDLFATEVIKEIGIDISNHVPRSLDELAEGNFDLIVTLAPDAHHKILELARTESVDIEYWPTYDATTENGSRNQKLNAYREVRDLLQAKIQSRFAKWLQT